MLNSPRSTFTGLQQRFSRQLSALTKETIKPSLFLLSGNSNIEAVATEAVGFDLKIQTLGKLALRQRVVASFRSAIPSLEVAIPGIVHWLNPGTSAAEAGVVLQEMIPEEFILRQPECLRNSCRYPCKVHGILHWTGPNTTTVSSTATVSNYSREGFCVQLSSLPEIGTKVTFRWPSEAGNRSVEGIVRWVISQSSGPMAGCEIIDSYGYTLNGIDA